MPDIFLSYSRKDAAQAIEIAERLRARGIEVWIDQSHIGAAASWSKEIVRAIDDCKAFMVLLSSSSVASNNVIREVALATESKKPVLPIALEDIKLSDDLRYHLSGIQRVAYTQFDAIAAALHGFGVSPKTVVAEKPVDVRKSLIVLPFDDLSPTQDNQWFADGLAGELIDMLGKIKSLRILDRKSSLDLRGVKQSVIEIGKLFNTRYIVQGSVRKFGEQIKISVSLLDIETGDHLWQDSYKGVMADIFELQESVAEKVVQGLKLHLTTEEQSLLEERGTENAEAYELCMKAGEYFERQSRDGFLQAIPMYEEAIRLDPGYVQARVTSAMSHIALYASYGHEELHLRIAEALLAEVEQLAPDQHRTDYPHIVIATERGDLDTAERMARDFVAQLPQKALSHFALAAVLSRAGKFKESIEEYTAAHERAPSDLQNLLNLVAVCDRAKDLDKKRYWSEQALPVLRKSILIHPENENYRVWEALLLCFLGQRQAAKEIADRIATLSSNPAQLYNLAVLYERLTEGPSAVRAFKRALELGFREAKAVSTFLPELEVPAPDIPEYEEAQRLVEQILSESADHASNA